ncbi:MAG: hypothetical protein RBT69_11315 [Spirochaetia bacterium]|jgi:arsenate reductase-like glutaredoxin family protein|nr:hypothetical protein [Spirochaetia bacterium]
MYQLIGRKSCRETKKAERFMKERNIDFQFVDLDKRELSAGELKSIFTAASPETLIDKDSKQFEKRGLKYMDFDPEEELLEDQKLIITPILRIKKKALARAPGCRLDESALQNFLQS